MRNPPRIVMVKENKNVAPSASTYKRWANTCVHGSIGKIHVPYTTIRVSLKVLLRSTMLKLTINNDKSGEKGGAQKDVQIYWSHVWHINIFSIYQKHVTYHTFPQMCSQAKHSKCRVPWRWGISQGSSLVSYRCPYRLVLWWICFPNPVNLK